MSKVTKLPNTKTITLGGIDLNCRVTGKSILNIEKRLNESIMGLFIKGEGEMKLPPSNKLLIILHETNTTSGIKEKDVVEAFYTHIENGNTTMDLFEQVNELLEEAGFFGSSDDKENDEASLDEEPAEDSIL